MFSEDKFIRENIEYIFEFSKNYKASMRFDDKFSACLSGFLCAIRTYQNKYGNFKEYANEYMKLFIEAERYEQNSYCRSERYNFSLDQVIHCKGYTFVRSDIIAIDKSNYELKAEINCIIDCLDYLPKCVCNMLRSEYNHIKVMETLKLNRKQYDEIIDELKIEFKDFI